jgi:hypothetical protein
MWHVGVDLHRKMVVIAAVHDTGEVRPPVRLQNSETGQTTELFRSFGSFRAVVEATGTYRWFQRLISPLGTVLLAHPGKLWIMVQRRSKTDTLMLSCLRISCESIRSHWRTFHRMSINFYVRLHGSELGWCEARGREKLTPSPPGMLQHGTNLQVPAWTAWPMLAK